MRDKLRSFWRELRYQWRGRREWRTNLREWLLEDGAIQGLGGPPNNWQASGKYAVRPGEAEYTARFLDDAFSIGVAAYWPEDGGESRWALILPAPVFRRLALWYLWRWTYGEWFGVRRWLFYRWLRRHVARMQQRRKG